MKVLLDEGVPRQLARFLRDHNVTTVAEKGWSAAKNGVLLALIEKAGFQALLTCDKNMQYQQGQLELKPFAILVLSTNHWPSMQPHAERVREALQACPPGTIAHVQCGFFVPRKLRKS